MGSWVVCFQSQNETSKLFPEVASILAAYLRNTPTRDPYHLSPATRKAYDQFTREVGRVFNELIPLAKTRSGLALGYPT